MTKSLCLRLAAMPWAELLDRFDSASRVGRPGGADHEQLREYFGAEELEALLGLRARALAAERRNGRERPVVVFLPGIMGSNLVAVRRGIDEDLVWIDYLGLAAGQMELLRLTPDGRREAETAVRVRCISVDKRAYAGLVVALSGHWDVQPFAFDWRKDLDLAADELAERIRDEYLGRPVHLVAHSMGGLVARRLQARHRGLWEKLAVGGQGGRLVMLGTPNYGSYDILRTLAGEQPVLRLLAAVDVKHSLRELQGVLAGFPGVYQVLPHAAKLRDLEAPIYRAGAWGEHPVSARHLRRALEFQEALAEPEGHDARRMAYVAGSNRETRDEVRIDAPGRFRYGMTRAGDGRVPHSLGVLANVATYFAGEAHGGLVRSRRVLDAVQEILTTGRTTGLQETPQRGRRQVGRRYAADARKGRLAPAPETPEGRRCAEDAIREAAMGEAIRNRLEGSGRAPRRSAGKRLIIEVVHGDISGVRAPVAVVGHYQGVAPVNAIGAIDRRLGGWLTEATRSSVLGGELGRLFYLPVADKLLQAAGVLVAGMGQEGRFTAADLRYLMQAVASAVAAWKMSEFATVLIGSGEGNIPIEKALRALVQGLCDALDRLPAGHRLKRILLVENDGQRAGWLRLLVEKMRREAAERGVDLRVSRGAAALGRVPKRAPVGGRRPVPANDAFGPRLTITRERETLRFTALTRQAVIPAREIEVQDHYLHGISEKLMRAGTLEEQHVLGRLLAAYLLPADLLDACDGDAPLTAVVDRTTAAVPWEMAVLPGSAAPRFLGTHLRLARQFQTLLAPAPALAPPPGSRLRALVIADPAPGDLHLAGAAEEGTQVARIFEAIRARHEVDLEVTARIGPERCDPIDILAMLLDGGFEVVHFAGHGVFDEARPNHSGWVFGREADGRLRTLSATEIFRARRAPRLVFSNACFSAATAARSSAFENSRALAGLAEAFFERGVPNYVGSGWAVGDAAATDFALEFYARALAGVPAAKLNSRAPKYAPGTPPTTLGEALASARTRVLGQGSTWGAYQHYGDPAAHLAR